MGDKICILDTFGFDRCRCRNYISPVKSFRPKKLLIVFRQYLSHLTCSRVHFCCVEIRIRMSCHVILHSVASCRVMSHYVTSCHVMPRDVLHVTSWHVMSRHVISRNVTSCHVMSHLAPPCHVMSYHVTSYHVESRGTVTRPTLHCQLTSSTRNQFKLSMTVFVGCPEGCRYNTASAVYDLVDFLNLCLAEFQNTCLVDFLNLCLIEFQSTCLGVGEAFSLSRFRSDLYSLI